MNEKRTHQALRFNLCIKITQVNFAKPRLYPKVFIYYLRALQELFFGTALAFPIFQEVQL